MQIVIDIPEGIYNTAVKGGYVYSMDESKVINAIANGKSLPKGHGRLIDEQNISDYVHSHIQEINTGYGDLNSHTNRILRMIESYIDNAPTIIEADKEDKDE